MKRVLILLIATLCMSGVFGSPRSLQQARRIVPHSERLTHAYTALQPDGNAAFYIFNRGTDEGFVIVSGDDRTHAILGYSDQGHWDETDIPDALRDLLAVYEEDIRSLGDASLAPARVQKARTPVTPFITTHWDQKAPYNTYCPAWGEGRCVTGCVATAAAQIMKWHHYPTQGTGSHSYKWPNENGDSIELSADFGQTTYQWSQMPDTYKDNYTEAQAEAVARLMHHCGVACEMNYGLTSGGNVPKMAQGLIAYFGYDKSMRYLPRNYVDEETILDAIEADLVAHRPVFIAAKTVLNTGHAFVCDGMDAEGLLHINWGWSGKSDGYFRISLFNPKEQGTGGSNRNYTENIRVITNIKPDEGSPVTPTFACANIRLDKSSCKRDETVRVDIDTLYNYGFEPYRYKLLFTVYRDGEMFKQHIPDYTYKSLNSHYYRKNGYESVSWSDLPVGEYELGVSIILPDQADIQVPLYRRWFGAWRCSMTVREDSIFYQCPQIEKPESSLPEVVDPTTYDFTLFSAYYYPSKSTETAHRWKLQLATPYFYSKDANTDPDQMLLLFHVMGSSATSLLGSYPYDSKEKTYCIGAMQYCGAASNTAQMVTYQADEGACTIAYAPAINGYHISYRLQLNKVDYSGEVDIPLSSFKAQYGEDYGTHKHYDPITLDNPALMGIEAIEEPSASAQKQLRNGHIYILRNGVWYTLNGTKLND